MPRGRLAETSALIVRKGFWITFLKSKSSVGVDTLKDTLQGHGTTSTGKIMNGIPKLT